MTKKYWVTLLLASFVAYGCGDDSNGNTDDNTNKTCSSNDECAPDVCVAGKCQKPSNQPCTGEDCPCTGEDCPQTCTGDDCPQTCTGDDCPQTCTGDDCGHVFTPVELNEGDKCEEGSKAEICKSPLVCSKGTCKSKEDAHKEGFCLAEADCADEDADHKACLPNGKCGKYIEKGDECDDAGDTACSGDLVCYDLACKEILAEGAPCGSDIDQICDPKYYLECIDSACRYKTIDIKKGKTCNSSYLLCASDLDCKAVNPDTPENTICVKTAKENNECNEADYIYCDKDLYCKDTDITNPDGTIKKTKTCQPLGKTCASSKECTEKDSYCCLSEEDCNETEYKHCITYDENHTFDETCSYKTKVGIFEAQIQCRWQPPSTQYSSSIRVEMPPLVGPFGNDAGLKTVVAFYSYVGNNVIRFMNPKNCETLESINAPVEGRWYNYPAAADLNSDGLLEFITVSSTNLYVYKWNSSSKKHEVWITIPNTDFRAIPNVFDIDNDNEPEILGPLGHVAKIHKDGTYELLVNEDLYVDQNNDYRESYTPEAGADVAVGYLFPDLFPGTAQIVTAEGVYNWNKTQSKWDKLVSLPNHPNVPLWVRQYPAYADFGTPGSSASSFDFTKLDGKPEIVLAGKNRIMIFSVYKKADGTFAADEIAHIEGFLWGGPVTIGDFNNDNLPEIAIASSALFGVYDPKCTGYVEGKCADKNVMWERYSQDGSSGTTGSSLFDFDGDGQAEAVYADECFTRVYEGKTGRVLFSAKRSSITSIEGPVVADIDDDGSAEILMGSDQPRACADDNGHTVYDGVDPIHEGIRCETNEDCPTKKGCNTTLHLCICTSDDDCNTQYAPGKTTYLQQYVCTQPIHPQTGMMINKAGEGKNRTVIQPLGSRPDGYDGSYKVCRATRKTSDIGIGDLMVFKDRLDRWVSSRALYNQHPYNIININDDGSVPNASQWLGKFNQKVPVSKGSTTMKPKYNNYRLNEQGLYGAGTVPDITGRFIKDSVCGTTKNKEGKSVHVISGNLCNRGTKPVSDKLPATFFYYKEDGDHQGEKICTSYTENKVGIGECYQVGCELTDEDYAKIINQKVLMYTNLDKHNQSITEECNYDNNTDTIVVERCDSDIVFDN